MKKFLALFLIVLLAFAAGCVTDSDDDKNDENNVPTTGDMSASTYLPMVDGATWGYRQIDSWGATGEEAQADTFTYTMTVTGTSVQNGKTYKTFTVVKDWGDGYIDTGDAYMRIEGDNLYVSDPTGALKPAVSEDAATEGTEEILAAKFKQSPGYSWTAMENTTTDEYGTSSITVTGTYTGLEDVTTAAGTFTNCARFDQVMVSNSQWIGEDPHSSTSTSTLWFAPNVGLIKQADRFTSANGWNENTDVECSSYSIP